MYANLRNVLFQRNITIKQFADFLDVGEKTIQNKINEITDFTYPEFRKTCMLLPEYNPEFLFSNSTEGKTA